MSNRPFSFVKYGRYSVAETVPGRIHARAIFEKVKIYFMNFLLTIFTVPFRAGVSLCTRGVPGPRATDPLDNPRRAAPKHLGAAFCEGATSCILPGPPMDVQQLRGSCAWKILPILRSCELQNSVHKKFIICLQFFT